MRELLRGDDLVQLAVDRGPVPANVGVLLVLDARVEPDLAQLEKELVRRLLRIPRLRQRLVEPTSWLRRRPYWDEVTGFDPRAHLTRTTSAAPGDTAALHAAAVQAVLRPLPRDRPLWRAVLVTGLQDGRLGLVLVLHHVVADGVGAMTFLAQLTAGTTALPPTPAASGPGHRRRDPAQDGAHRRTALRRLVVGASRVGRGGVDLVLTMGRPAPRCSLNVPTGPRRRIATVDVDLAEVKAGGRRHGATVNDVLLVAVVAGLAAVLQQRGERVAELVVSVPVSARTATTSGSPGNRVGVMPVRLPVHGPVQQRLASVSLATRRTKQHGRSSASVAPFFRLLAAVGLVQWLTNRQRLVNSFLSNVRGPTDPLTVAGLPVLRLVPLTSPGGNIGASFTAVSYAGTLTVTVTTDPDVVTDVAALAAAVRAELETIADA
ncbi:wax ester/triacylglycerol synthase domain-containing protein [Aquipuribacter sp. MA13-6]|uniref:wax ester/triacylglycerol synthase domain-containing protein n=1 Tax=unclassified Aquipuribacter TaxID=2635084 RepID=UPI003EEE72FA